MATSGQHSWALTIGDVIDEAVERCGIDPAAAPDRYLNSARRSLNLLYTELETISADMPFRIERVTMTLPSGMRGLILPVGTIDVLDVVATISGTDYPLSLSSRSTYATYANKAQTAAWPNEYFVSKQMPTDTGWLNGASGSFNSTGVFGVQPFGGGTPAAASVSTIRVPAIFFYPIPTANIALVINRLRTLEDARFLGEDADINRVWSETLCAGLAVKIAVKFATDRVDALMGLYQRALTTAKTNISDRGSVIIGGRGIGRTRQRRN